MTSATWIIWHHFVQLKTKVSEILFTLRSLLTTSTKVIFGIPLILFSVKSHAIYSMPIKLDATVYNQYGEFPQTRGRIGRKLVTSSSQSRSSLSPILSAAKMVTARREVGRAMAKRMLLVVGPACATNAVPLRCFGELVGMWRSTGGLGKGGALQKEEIGLERENKVAKLAIRWCFSLPASSISSSILLCFSRYRFMFYVPKKQKR